MDRLAKLTNFAVLCAALLFSFVLIRDHVWPQSKPSKSDILREQSLVGQSLELAGVAWQTDRSLVLVLSANCRFCTASSPFYRNVITATKATGVTTIAVFPQSVLEGERYLATAGITVDRVISLEPAAIGATGTPTLLIVGKTGRVDSMWVGQLSQTAEQEVLKGVS